MPDPDTENQPPQAAPMPMFPLGTVLVPTMLLPLRVFEPRYQQMTRDCLAADGEFGVVLIERGSEVGGGDVRTHVGTVGSIIRSQEFPDGRWALLVQGRRRIKVESWLADDPYPRAEVQDWPDLDAEGYGERLPQVTATWRRLMAMSSELGMRTPSFTEEFSSDPDEALWQLVAVSPTGPFDRQRLLQEENPVARVTLLEQLLEEAHELLQARLSEN